VQIKDKVTKFPSVLQKLDGEPFQYTGQASLKKKRMKHQMQKVSLKKKINVWDLAQLK
jgi:hypothetical protein